MEVSEADGDGCRDGGVAEPDGWRELEGAGPDGRRGVDCLVEASSSPASGGQRSSLSDPQSASSSSFSLGISFSRSRGSAASPRSDIGDIDLARLALRRVHLGIDLEGSKVAGLSSSC